MNHSDFGFSGGLDFAFALAGLDALDFDADGLAVVVLEFDDLEAVAFEPDGLEARSVFISVLRDIG